MDKNCSNFGYVYISLTDETFIDSLVNQLPINRSENFVLTDVVLNVNKNFFTQPLRKQKKALAVARKVLFCLYT
jgi:hypothetical protein